MSKIKVVVISANLTRRHLDEFQKAEIPIRFDKLFRKIARDRWIDSKFTSETGREAYFSRTEDNVTEDGGRRIHEQLMKYA